MTPFVISETQFGKNEQTNAEQMNVEFRSVNSFDFTDRLFVVLCSMYLT